MAWGHVTTAMKEKAQGLSGGESVWDKCPTDYIQMDLYIFDCFTCMPCRQMCLPFMNLEALSGMAMTWAKVSFWFKKAVIEVEENFLLLY